jgi:hypothetical protein
MAQDAATLAYIAAAAPDLSILALYLFIHIARQLKNDIILTQPRDIPEDSPPAHLPPSVKMVLGRSCGIADEKVDELWSVLKVEVWDGQGIVPAKLDEVLTRNGIDVGLLPNVLYPPRHSCVQPGCSRSTNAFCLKQTKNQEVVLYTLTQGAVPAYAVSLYCTGVLIFDKSFPETQDIHRLQSNIPSQLLYQRWCTHLLLSAIQCP